MNTETSYMGITLANPVIASASPLTYTLDGVRRLAASGVGAIVMHSLFEEEIESDAERRARLLEAGSESYAESLSYFPDASPAQAAKRYLSLLERAAGLGVPVIGSLNAAAPGSWVAHAREIEGAGARAIELNIHVLPGAGMTGGRAVEALHVEIVEQVKSVVSIPVAVKMSPYFSSVGEMAVRLDAAGADAVVLFSRFVHPDIDPDLLRVAPGIGLSNASEARLSRTWVALLHGRLRAAIAGATGVDQPGDVVSYILAGADVVMTTSALLRHGPGYARELVDGTVSWMERKGFDALTDFRGLLAARQTGNQVAEERAGYVEALRAANANIQGPW